MILALLISTVSLAQAGPVASFDTNGSLQQWIPNAQFEDVAIADGVLYAKAVAWDAFFSCHGLQIPATPWQYVHIRLRAFAAGKGELFWSGTTEGEYSGLSQEKSTPFQVRGTGEWEDIVVVPFWQGEGSIVQLRLDVYDGAAFAIDKIDIGTWAEGDPSADTSWNFIGEEAPWKIHPASDQLISPPLRLPVESYGWVAVTLSATEDGAGRLLWSRHGANGLDSEGFSIIGDGQPRVYNIETQSFPHWKGELAALGLQLPEEAGVQLESVVLGTEPVGVAELAVQYFGFENGLNRAGRPERVTLQAKNIGGAPPDRMEFEFSLPAGLALTSGGELPSRNPAHGESVAAFWEMSAAEPGSYPLDVTIRYDAQMTRASTTLEFSAPLGKEKAEYVPEPRPIAVSHEVCMYYFPGWGKLASWDPIQRVAPWRKPVLGWYDESKPEVVDWQIKWATENGISCFLVDWYWTAGNQHLTHWFEAYRKAVYRDKLKVAIMWANHNPPDTHSREDWRLVTQEWIDRYFNLPSYYTVMVKSEVDIADSELVGQGPPYLAMPAIFLWDPSNIRRDLGSSEEVAAAFQESQEMARAAGYPGIAFIALHGHESPSGVQMLAAEGYSGATNYHEWGKAQSMAKDPMWLNFADVVSTVEETWKAKTEECAPLTYYPVADTGWDARPWHGSKSMVIEGRTPALWEELLRKAKAFTEAAPQRIVVLGPANEWGEGSYVMPCTEYNFDMLEAVRRVFAVTPESDWPQNFGPRDVGLGPYDFPVVEPVSSWQFQHGPEDWGGMMGVSGLQVEGGSLVFKTTSSDPALSVATNGVAAERFSGAYFRARYTATEPAASNAQLFWSAQGSGTSEAESVSLPVKLDSEWHEYLFDLKSNPRWRGQITMLRFDPCSTANVQVELDSVQLVEAEGK